MPRDSQLLRSIAGMNRGKPKQVIPIAAAIRMWLSQVLKDELLRLVLPATLVLTHADGVRYMWWAVA